MNWRYLVPRFVIVAIAWVFFTFAFDPLVRMGVISTGETVAGAKVRVDQLRTGFFPPRLELSTVEVANQLRPGRNLFEFGELKLNVRGDALLMKRVVVESGEITGIRIGDPRPDDGLLEQSDDEGGPSVLDGYSKHFENVGAQWLDDLAQQAKLELDPNQLETYRVGEQIHEKWDRRMTALRQQVEILKPQLKQVESLVKGAKHSKPLLQVQQYSQAATDTQTLVQKAQQLTTEFRGFPAEFKRDMAQLNQARINDQQMIKSKAQLLKPDPARITELLFGPKMTGQLKEALAWLNTAKQYKEALTGGGIDPDRGPGRYVLFPMYEEHPGFLMKELKLSGHLSFNNEELPFHATIGGITSDPAMLGKPVLLQLGAKGGSQLQLKAEFDRTGDKAINRLVLMTRDARPTQNELGNQRSMAVDVTAGMSDWNCQFEMVDNQIQGVINLAQVGVAMSAHGEKVKHPILQRVLADLLSSIDQLDCTLNVSGTPTAPKLAVSSSLGPKISTGLRMALLNEVDVQKQELAIKAQAFATKEINSVQSRLSAEYTQLAGEHKDLMEGIQLVRSLVPSGDPRKMKPADIIRTASQNRVIQEKVQDKLGRAVKKSSTAEKVQRELDRFGGLGNLGGLLPPGFRPKK